MKKNTPLYLIKPLVGVGTVAVLSLSSVYAQEGLHLYGVIDSGVGWTRISGENRTTGLMTNGQEDSFWGLKGSEALSKGFRANFQLESGFDAATGTAEEESSLFNYAAWLGLEQSALGELRLGRQSPVAQQFADELEIASWADFGLGALFKAADRYQYANSASYLSPKFAGLQAGLSYSFDVANTQHGQGSDKARALSTGVRYSTEALYVTLTYDRLTAAHYKLPEAKAAQAWQLGARYDMDGAELAAGWSRQRNGFVGLNGADPVTTAPSLEGIGPLEFAQGGRLDAWYVGAAVPVAQGQLKVQWSMAKPNWRWHASGQKAKAAQVYSIGYVYELSPRTSVYAFAAQGHNYHPESSLSPDNPTTRRLMAGLTHYF